MLRYDKGTHNESVVFEIFIRQEAVVDDGAIWEDAKLDQVATVNSFLDHGPLPTPIRLQKTRQLPERLLAMAQMLVEKGGLVEESLSELAEDISSV